MITDIRYQNEKGNVFSILPGNNYPIADNIYAVSVSDLSAIGNTNVSTIAGYDGGTIVSNYLSPISPQVILRGFKKTFQDIKPKIYDIFKMKSFGTIFADIEENGKTTTFKLPVIVQQISFQNMYEDDICSIVFKSESAYWIDEQSNSVLLSSVLPNWEYPLQIEEIANVEQGVELSKIDNSYSAKITNEGDTEVGCIFEIKAVAAIANPKIINVLTNKFIGVSVSMLANDQIFINTNVGQKSIMLLRNNVKTDMFNNLMQGSTFLQLAPGENTFQRECDEDLETNMEVKISYNNKRAWI